MIERLGHYRILGRVGGGGMGEVYQAEDVNLRRIVALKLLPETLSDDPIARERLFREARAASKLSHPHIATIYEFDEADGRLFLAMEFVEGEALSLRLRGGPLPVAEVVRLGIEVAQALEYAHAHDIVHRDIKPGNILVGPETGVKVVDFGLAVHPFRTEEPRPGEGGDESATEEIRLTRTGFSAGTVAYMSPEQARGERVDHRSDLFSLGVVLYEALTGKLPFSGASPVSVAAAILHLDPAAPRTLDPSIPSRLQEIVLSCMRKRPEERPPDAASVGGAPRAFDQGSSPRIVRRALRARTTGRRKLLPVVATAAVLAIFGLTLPTLLDRHDHEIADPEARRLFRMGRTYEDRGNLPQKLAVAERAYRGAAAREPGNPVIEASLAIVLARQEMQAKQEGRLEEIRAIAARGATGHPELAVVWIASGWRHLLEKRNDAAEADARKAQELDPKDWRAPSLLGEALIQRGEVDAGLDAMRRAIDTREETRLEAIGALATRLVQLQRDDEAAVEYQRLLRFDPQNYVALFNLAAIYLRNGRPLDSIPLYESLLAVEPDADSASNLGTAYFFAGRMEDAARAYERAWRIDPTKGIYARNLAESFEKLGRLPEARSWFATAEATYAKELEAGGPRAALLAAEGFCAAKLGRRDEAARLAEEALALRPGDAEIVQAGAQALALAGRRDRAFELVREALRAGYPRQAFAQDPVFAPFLADGEFQRILAGPSR